MYYRRYSYACSLAHSGIKNEMGLDIPKTEFKWNER